MSENNKSKFTWGTISLIVLVLSIVFKLCIRNDKTESIKDSEEMTRIINESSKDTYSLLKHRLLNLSFEDIGDNYKNSKVLAVLFDVTLDSSIVTIAVTIDSTASVLIPNKDNSLWIADKESILSISDSIFKDADLYKTQMNKFTGKINKPEKKHITVYVRTNELLTYVKDIDIKNKNIDKLTMRILKDYSKLWKTLREKK